jgi:VWFA-related protein
VYNLLVVATIRSGLLFAIPLSYILPIALTAQNSPHGPVIRVQVDSVLVPVVVRDPKGQVASDLTKDDFQIFDNGKLISISGFAIEKRAEIYSRRASEPLNSAPQVSNRLAGAQASASVPTRFIVFVFDNLHLSVAELMRVEKAASSIFTETMTETDMAAVVSLSGMNSGLTHDTAKLQEAVSKIRVQQVLRHDDHACPNIDYYQADLIQNKRSEMALEAAEADFITCANLVGQSPNMVEAFVRSAASKSLINGENDMYVTLTNIREIVKKMCTLSGERTLILISPGFFAQTSSAMAEKSQILDIAARCNVTVSAIDARGLYTTVIDASEQGGSSGQDLMTGGRAQRHSDEMNFNEDVMSELAEGTGGKFFHNNNDLENGLKTLAAAPEVVYLLAISLETVKHDGSYHSLKVKVGKKGLKTQARRGYFAPEKEKPKKSPLTPGYSRETGHVLFRNSTFPISALIRTLG